MFSLNLSIQTNQKCMNQGVNPPLADHADIYCGYLDEQSKFALWTYRHKINRFVTKKHNENAEWKLTGKGKYQETLFLIPSSKCCNLIGL